jgi:hypothetical protein
MQTYRPGRAQLNAKGNPAAGRPGGLLISWIKCATEFVDQADHQLAGQKSMTPTEVECFDFARGSIELADQI